MNKRIFGVLAVSLLSVSTLVFVAGPAGAQTKATPTTVEWEQKQDIDLTAFRYLINVLPVDVVVPTVVEVPVPASGIRNRTAIVKDNNGIFVPALYQVNAERQLADVKVFGNGTNPVALVDGRFETQSDFPYENGRNTFVDGGSNEVGLAFYFSEPVTTSELYITLAPNVTLPKTIKIEVPGKGSTSEDDAEIVVAERPLTSSIVKFPEITTEKIFVTFKLNQPLRLSELTFVQKTATVYEDSIRFLAGPVNSYTVYLDPDRAYGRLISGGGNLTSDKDVKVLPAYPLGNNPQYSLADSDEDGVPDERDNCVSMENADQKDIDGNGRGDVCDDFDRDGLMTVKDNCPEVPNRDQRDTDGDGIGDACDTEEDRFTERNPWIPWFGMGIAALVLGGLLFITARHKVVPDQTPEETPEEEKPEEEQVSNS